MENKTHFIYFGHIMINFYKLLLSIFLLIFGLSSLKSQDTTYNPNPYTEKYQDVVMTIIKGATKDTAAWERLAYMCDTYGPRLSGSVNIEQAANWLFLEMKKYGLSNIKSEQVMVPHWVRGNEKCELITPRKCNLRMLGLGGSVATPPEGITAPVLIVKDFDELTAKAKEAKGKIVIFNCAYEGYGKTVAYRWSGALKAATVGAVASLIRSVSPVGFQNPHTGVISEYPDTLPKIPHAALTGEDIAMLQRMQNRGQHPVIHLYMEAKMLPDTISHNVMGEIVGTEYPDEIIAVGGHLDSWDVGTGAQDDGGGMFAGVQAVKLLHDLGIKTKRTIRAVAWTNEENGNRGGKAYAESHKNEKHALMFEFDSGVFPPSRIGYSSEDTTLFEQVKLFEPLLNLVAKIKVDKGGGGVDISPMMNINHIPGIGLGTDDEGKYFWYHHSPLDTPEHVSPQDLNLCIAAIAVTVYLYSELP